MTRTKPSSADISTPVAQALARRSGMALAALMPHAPDQARRNGAGHRARCPQGPETRHIDRAIFAAAGMPWPLAPEVRSPCSNGICACWRWSGSTSWPRRPSHGRTPWSARPPPASVAACARGPGPKRRTLPRRPHHLLLPPPRRRSGLKEPFQCPRIIRSFVQALGLL